MSLITSNHNYYPVRKPFEEIKGNPNCGRPLQKPLDPLKDFSQNSLGSQGFSKRPPLHPRKNMTPLKNEPMNSLKAEDRITHLVLEKMVNDVINFQGPGTYQNLQDLREAKRTLMKCTKCSSDEIGPLLLKLKVKKSEVLKNPDVRIQVFKDRILAKREGEKSRNAFFTTSQMYSLLNGRIIGNQGAKLKIDCQLLCRDINEVMENPGKFAGKSLQMKARSKLYPFFNYENKRTENLKLNFTYWLEVSKDVKNVELFIIPLIDKPLGSGNYKNVHFAQSFKFPIQVQRDLSAFDSQLYKRSVIYSPQVVLEAKTLACVEQIEEGIELQRKLLEAIPANELTSLPLKLPSESTLYRQDWYHCDLLSALKTRKVPLDLSQNAAALDLDNMSILNIFQDVALTLQKMHKAGFVHRDVKPNNILLKSDGQNKLKGIIADYDFSQSAGSGHTPVPCDYKYWDTLSEQGIITPFTDLYGLAMSLAEVFIPQFKSINPLEIHSKNNQYNFIEEAKKHSKENGKIVEKIICFILEVLKKDHKMVNTYSQELRQKHKDFLIQQYFYPHLDVVQEIFNTINKNEKLSVNEEFQAFEGEIYRKFSSRTLDDTTKSKLRESHRLVKQKLNIYEMEEIVNKIDPKHHKNFHLFWAISHPRSTKIKKIDRLVNREIEMLYMSSIVRESISLLYNGIITDNEQRQDIKKCLKENAQSSFQPLELRLDSQQVLDQINILEERGAYLYELCKIEENIADQIVTDLNRKIDPWIHMQKFIEFLGELKEELLTNENK